MNFKKENKLFLLISIVLLIVFIFFISFLKENNNNHLKNNECLIKKIEKTVRGMSLFPLFKTGDRIEIYAGYYNCHPVKRNDVVIYHYNGDKNPLIKIIKGIPGDKFKLRKINTGWSIYINNKILKNSEGIPYLLNNDRSKMLLLYERTYRNIIPNKSYLILGNVPSGSLDSTIFGFIGKNDILGKVVKKL